ncbi:hypothetical protein QR680_009806 [Steinernema hermaphroditum]|uniref:Uncharacterized protein n=1 Tax=Steinernema hermaphroditum TaxID=289476 RepID=A0AA39INE8_9BILA|nr:hypothetical protein QR680_009806 [Steinernema hermaphroditum]
MTLMLAAPRIFARTAMLRATAVRTAVVSATPKQSLKKLEIPNSESGFFKYDRDFSRDKRYSAPQKKGDTPKRFLLRRLDHAYELYPLIALTAIWFVLFCYAVSWSLRKVEVWIDRSQETAPWDWEKIRQSYWQKPTLFYDPEGVTSTRIELMEKLQDEMISAARKRGTR